MPENTPTIYPALAYRDAPAAMKFLSNAFGFAELMVAPGENGSIVHAEMNLGSAVIMLGSNRPEMGWVSPDELPAVSQTLYVAIDDVTAIFAQMRGDPVGPRALADRGGEDRKSVV